MRQSFSCCTSTLLLQHVGHTATNTLFRVTRPMFSNIRGLGQVHPYRRKQLCRVFMHVCAVMAWNRCAQTTATTPQRNSSKRLCVCCILLERRRLSSHGVWDRNQNHSEWIVVLVIQWNYRLTPFRNCAIWISANTIHYNSTVSSFVFSNSMIILCQSSVSTLPWASTQRTRYD